MLDLLVMGLVKVSPNKSYHLLVLTFKPITNHLLPHILYANQPLTQSLLVSLVDHVVHNLCSSSGKLCFFSPSPPGGLLRVLIGTSFVCLPKTEEISSSFILLIVLTYLFLCLPLRLIVPTGQRE